MSRGLGKIQRAVLSVLKRQIKYQYPSTRELAAEVYRCEQPTVAQLVATRRALRQMATLQLVLCCGRQGGGLWRGDGSTSWSMWPKDRSRVDPHGLGHRAP
jgi:hypothetical protein